MVKKILRTFLISILITFFLILVTITYMIFSYRLWQEDFEKDIPSQELVMSTEGKEKENLEEKIDDILYSSEETAILELSTMEVSSLLLDSFQGNESLDIEVVYIDPIEKGRWDVYFKTNLLEKISIWVRIKARKENRETAEIFVEDVLIGKYSLKSLGLSNSVEKMNGALSSALITVEENGFVGRTIENIELLDSGMVIRLERY